jgi:drug/metabolite transporter (DMT)-like permease
MLWTILGIIAAATWSVSAFIDNYLADVIFKGKKPQAVKVINGPVNIVLAIIFAIVMQVQIPELWQIGVLLFSGALNAIGTLAYYQALKREEATGIAIFYQLQPVFFLLIDYFIFNEKLNPHQLIGLIAILLAPLVIIFAQRRKNARRTEIIAAMLLVLYVVLATISAEITIRFSAGLNFLSVFVFFILGRGITDTIIGLTPSVRKRHQFILKKFGTKYSLTAALNQAICTAADFLYRYALVLGIAAIASALTNAAELVLTFIFGIIFSIIWPNFGREKLQRRLVASHIIAIILCIIGIIIIQ